MPKRIEADELDRLGATIARFAQGVDIDGLLEALGDAYTRRTLQRRIADLIRRGRVIRHGEGKASKYRIVPVGGVLDLVLPTPQVELHGEAYVPISAEGEEIRRYVRRPIQGRRPVGYNLQFLDGYRPNITAYLAAELREQLHALGRSPVARAPAGTFARDILGRLLIDLSWASSKLEGNTYSRLDTERLIEFGQAARGKDAIETQMILNHKEAIEYLVHDAERVRVDEATVVALHAFLSDGLLADPLACGRLRNRTVEIGGSVYRPIGLPQRVAEMFRTVLEVASRIEDPFEQAFFLLVHLPYLQPFEDVNKRVSRLAANIPLIKANVSPLSFIDVPEKAYVDALLGVYELNRVELLRDVFVWAYERSCQQYVAVQSQLVPPDAFRLRYRASLGEAIRALVRANRPVTVTAIRASIPASVLASDRKSFVELVRAELETMHAGNAVRFGVRPLEFEAWKRRRARKA